jgi:hypothetical protein
MTSNDCGLSGKNGSGSQSNGLMILLLACVVGWLVGWLVVLLHLTWEKPQSHAKKGVVVVARTLSEAQRTETFPFRAPVIPDHQDIGSSSCHLARCFRVHIQNCLRRICLENDARSRSHGLSIELNVRVVDEQPIIHVHAP